MADYGEYDLVIEDGLGFTRTFMFFDVEEQGVWPNYNARMQLRHPWTGELLIELTAFLEPGLDPTRLDLVLPADFTGLLPDEAIWDILGTHKTTDAAFRMPRPAGRLLVHRGVTLRD